MMFAALFFATAWLSEEGQVEPYEVLDGITFPSSPGTLFVPLREIAGAFDLPVGYDRGTKERTVAGVPVLELGPILLDGTTLVPVRAAADWGAVVVWDQAVNGARVSRGNRAVLISRGEKRVVVSKETQELVGYQGERVVIRTHVSTGRIASSTPTGTWTAKMKKRIHYSSLYNNSPMPFSVQVVGNIFIHGYPEVPERPASHGCVRVPLDGDNPAEKLFEWIDIGTPVTIEGAWQSGR